MISEQELNETRYAILAEMEKTIKENATREEVYMQILDAISRRGLKLDFRVREQFIEELIQDVTGFGPIQEFLNDPSVTEIWIYGYDKIVIEKDGERIKTEARFRDDQHLRNTLEKIIAPVGKRLDESEPRVDARLPDGSRLNAVIPPIAVDGTQVTIRKFKRSLTIYDLIKSGSLTWEAADFLAKMTRGRANIIVSGGTSSGKTTLLNCLSEFWGEMESIVVIEDPAELNLKGKWVRRMEARGANMQGEGEVTVRDLVKNSLRQAPDRIIVGEIRDGTAVDMVQAMMTGHSGSMSTIHADNVESMANNRLPDLISEGNPVLSPDVILKRVASAIDIGVHAEQVDGKRRVVQIAEITGVKDGVVQVNNLFVFKNGSLQKVGEPSQELLERTVKFGVDWSSPLLRKQEEPKEPIWSWEGEEAV
ncbi:type II secretion system protein E [Caldalkalibacillus thermarum]|uniref:CpaF family protein n=1 Tax=Caldalkalibacillus thermarum TaxID=296745 RepID=UPI00166C8699|nr:CpaF family protein [Caldalkalibacillus thermarum]GGK34953.1 type II secretion system protein E [Caldalkalibacillus thermarum]